jgi:hypothetical protein
MMEILGGYGKTSGNAAHPSKLYYYTAARLRICTFATAPFPTVPTDNGNCDLICEFQSPILINDGLSTYEVLAVGIKKRIWTICAAERSNEQCGNLGNKRTPNKTPSWENHNKCRGRGCG